MGKILSLTEDSVWRRPCGIVHRQQQCEPGSSVLQPGVVTAIELQEHPLLGHPLTPVPVARRLRYRGMGNPALRRMLLTVERLSARMAAASRVVNCCATSRFNTCNRVCSLWVNVSPFILTFSLNA